MSRLQELDALSRERALTRQESDALYRALKLATSRSQSAEAKRARYPRYKDAINARKRERYATDPEWRARKLAADKASYKRHRAKRKAHELARYHEIKAKQCSA